MVIHPFVCASVFSAVFLRLQTAASLRADIRGSLMYGAGVFCVGSLPVFLLAFASFQVPMEVIAAWVVQSLCQYLAAGIALGIVADRMALHRSEPQQMNSTHLKSRRARRRVIRILALLALIYISICVYFWATQVSKILAPLREIPTNPERMGMSYVRVSIPIRDHKNTEIGQLKASWVPVENPEAPVILYLHGQDATRGKNLEHTERFHQWGWNVLIIDYRGFGESYGYKNLCEATVYEDAVAALMYLKDGRRFAPNKIFIYGHSLGGAVAIELATKEESSDTAGLIVESTFTSIQDMSGEHYDGWLKLLPVSLLLTEKFDSLSKIKSVKLPILFIHGKDDEKVPFKMSEELHRTAGGSNTLCLIAGARHENCGSIGKVEYRRHLDEFITACLKKAEPGD